MEKIYMIYSNMILELAATVRKEKGREKSQYVSKKRGPE